MPIQQLMLGVGVSKKTYMDDVFSNYLYLGNQTARSFNNGIDLSGEGGMTWIKHRDGTYSHNFFDTERGATKSIYSNLNIAEEVNSTTLTSFNSNGFSIGTHGSLNATGNSFASWSFRKAKGFFDVISYTGNGSNRTIAHSLGSVPGMIFIKRTNDASDWIVYHQALDSSPEDYLLNLNTNAAKASAASTYFQSTAPTSSVFSLGSHANVNGNGETYVAYVFAGGKSTTATARSVDFDGSDDQLNIPDSTDWDLGNGDFTLETWIKSTQTTSGYFTALGQWQDSGNNRSWMIRYASQDIGTGWSFFYSTDGSNYTTTMGSDISDGQWHHIAVTRTGGNLRTFTDGILNTTRSTSDTFYAGAGTFTIGGQSGNYFDGQLSNVRLVKGTALYTSSFRPPTKPLTNVTNTKLLCCNNSSVTGSTITPGTITTSSSPTASTDSPFDDSAGFVFGDSGSESVIKHGSYSGDGTKNHDIYLGWEAAWVMIKCTTASENWLLFDVMRGIVTGGNDGKDAKLYSNTNDSEVTNTYNLEVTSTGFKLTQDQAHINSSGNSYIFTAIRRPDGYVGKPVELGTDVFALDTGNGSSGPAFDSGFPVDMGLRRLTETGNDGTPSTDWATYNRLLGGVFLRANTTAAIQTSTRAKFDFNDGFNHTDDSTFQAWMWKRHTGFDVVAYKGSGLSAGDQQDVPHSMNKTPEMMWVKIRDADNQGWMIYHKGLNGGTNPEQYKINFSSNAESSFNCWDNTAPTATSFRVGNQVETNHGSYNFIAMLFASVDGISKVGSYTGSASSQTITLGFQPRLLIVKKYTGSPNTNWYLIDTLRGWGSGDDKYLELNTTAAQADHDFGAPTSTGMTLPGGEEAFNASGSSYIYYAHA